jgi:hypothetical protein
MQIREIETIPIGNSKIPKFQDFSICSSKFRSAGRWFTHLSPIPYQARPSRSDHERRVVRLMVKLDQLQLKASQKDAPDHFDLLVRKRQSDASVMAAAESD